MPAGICANDVLRAVLQGSKQPPAAAYSMARGVVELASATVIAVMLMMRRTVALEVNDVHSLLDLVDENLGIAVVPRHFRHKRPALTALGLKGTGEAAYETVALVPSPRATSPAARALMALLDDGGA